MPCQAPRAAAMLDLDRTKKKGRCEPAFMTEKIGTLRLRCFNARRGLLPGEPFHLGAQAFRGPAYVMDILRHLVGAIEYD